MGGYLKEPAEVHIKASKVIRGTRLKFLDM